MAEEALEATWEVAELISERTLEMAFEADAVRASRLLAAEEAMFAVVATWVAELLRTLASLEMLWRALVASAVASLRREEIAAA